MTNNSEIAIKLENIHKTFSLPHEKTTSIKTMFTKRFRYSKEVDIQHALKGIDFEVKKGEFFGIVGRNGSGKSTLLKIIAGIYQPNKGNVNVNGRLVPFIELGVGFNPELSGRENVYLNGALMGFSASEIKLKYQEIVEFSELERFMDQRLKNYSSGMQVRLAFSVATILAESDILLIDEVLAVGDADFQRKCFDYFRKLKKQKKTAVFVSHDMNSVREYCDRAILIDGGKIVFSGSSEEAAKEYTRLFLPKESKRKSNEAGKWGNGKIDIVDISLPSSITEADKELKIKVKIKVLQEIADGIIPGFTIKNDVGHSVCGTNSKILQLEPIAVSKGKTLELEWSIPNIFNSGMYVVEPAVNEAGNGETCQWWDNAIKFESVNEHSTPYSVAPIVKLKHK